MLNQLLPSVYDSYLLIYGRPATQVKGAQRLKAHIQKALNGGSRGNDLVLCGLQGF